MAMASVHDSSSPMREKPKRYLFGALHLVTAMKLLVTVGILVIFVLLGVLYFKFRKAIFVLGLPTAVSAATVAAIIFKSKRFVWPVIAISMFHVVLASYALLIFSFYFIFKPFYIIMVLNWAFDTLHTDKTPSYYLQCGAIFSFLICFALFNTWQAYVSIHYRSYIDHKGSQRQPTILVVNKQPMY